MLFQRINNTGGDDKSLSLLTDGELIRKSRAGDRDAFGELVTRYQKRAFALAYSFLGNRDDALNISQECFIRIWRNLKRFKEKEPFYPWFYRILKNLCLSQVRKHSRRAEISLDEAFAGSMYAIKDTADNPEEAVEIKERSEHLWKAIFNLKSEYREIILMRHFENLTYSEMVQALNIPKGTVMSRLYHARKKLASQLKEML